MKYRYIWTRFAYADYLGQKGYGHSLSAPGWVIEQISKIPGIRIIHFAERAWGDHQDVYACGKIFRMP